ncbi:MAG TPA: metalloregulator ArsR/SmtB family transcription factor, partial [Actinomycetota bacterium]|nr:metalloregulator ArsR/SmtB family transcription factor [Actinomycetota bacterium]
MDRLQIVAEPRRREILRLVWDRELSAGEIADRFDVSFAAVSQHLGVLRDARLVSVRRDGRRRLYRADRAGVGDLRTTLEWMWS